jgi:hypothetical protein
VQPASLRSLFLIDPLLLPYTADRTAKPNADIERQCEVLKSFADSEAGHKLRNGHLECPGEHFEIANADFFLAVLQVGNEAPVQADVLGHVHLCPLALLAEGAQPFSQANTDITGHPLIMAVGFRR